MILKGLSQYDVSIEHGEVVVKSLHFRFRNRKMRYYDAKKTKYWFFVGDDGAKHSFSEGKLRFLLGHPGISFLDLDCRGNKISFRSSNGSVIPMGQTLGNRRYDVFLDYDDAMETLLIMKRYSLGDVSAIYDFCERRKNDAIAAVARLRGVTFARVESAWEDALLLLDAKLVKFNVRRIVPLYCLLCQQLRNAVTARSRTMRLNESVTYDRQDDSSGE